MPSEASLRDAAWRYLSRYAATEARLTATLARRAQRWAAAARAEGAAEEDIAPVMQAAQAAIIRVVAACVADGSVNDQAYAQSRGRSLARAGRSARAAAAHLAARGLDAELIGPASARDAEAELACALIHARKRRLGPFAAAAPPAGQDPARLRARALASFARAGFAAGVALRALRMPREEAESRIIAFRAAL